MQQPKRWLCQVCGYVHEGETPPDACPVCGVGPEMFVPYEEKVPISEPDSGAWRCTVCGEILSGDAPPEMCPVCGVAAELFVPHKAGERTPAAVAEIEDSPASVNGGPRIVVVGGGIAGITAAEQARKTAPDATILVVHKEPEPPYNRLNLTRFLGGEIDETQLTLHALSWYRDNRIELVSGEALRIDRTAHQLVLRRGEVLGYDRLVLANGAHPFMPPIPGTSRSGVLPLRTWQNARTILSRAKPGSHAVVVGGGLLGLEAAGAMARRGVSVVVLEGFTWLLPRQLAEPAGQMLRRHMEGLGIVVRVKTQVKEILGDEGVGAVQLEGGETLPADLVVMATGVRPNSYLARQCGLEVNRGVVVDDWMCTSDPDIYAAGDVAEHRGLVYGLWPAAMKEGSIAGHNAAREGEPRAFGGLPASAQLKVLDVAVFSIGEIIPADGSFNVYEKTSGDTYTRLVCHDGCLVGANLFGDTRPARHIKKAIEQKQQLTEARELLELYPDLVAFRSAT